MIVCLDTNVFVSGIFWKGAPSRILQLWIDGVIEELLGWMDFAKSRSRLVTPSKWPEITCRDPADKKFLTCALEGRADFLITGDDDLLELKGTVPLEILTPHGFLSLK